MAKLIHKGRQNAAKTVARKARARRSASFMKLEFKNSEEGRHTMCRAMEKIEARGKRENMLATAKRMLKDGILALKDVAKYSGLSLAQVKKLQASMA